MLIYAAQPLPQFVQTVHQTKFSDAVCNTQVPMFHTLLEQLESIH